MKRSVVESYEEAWRTSKPNTIPTWYAKSRSYPDKIIRQGPLYASGELSEAIRDAEVSVEEGTAPSLHPGGEKWKSIIQVVWYLPTSGPTVFSDFEWAWNEGWVSYPQTRKNQRYVYLWSHEFGARASPKMFKFGVPKYGNFSIPRRPFFVRGLKRGFSRALAFTTNVLTDYIRWAKSHEVPPFTMPDIGLEREFHWSARDIVMLVAPPTNYYSLVGGSLDIFNALRGEFTIPNYEQWLTQYAKGQVGATKMTQRRYFRKGVWK